MPWTAKDATRHTKKAKSARQRRQWAHVAESMRRRGMSEGRAIAAASGVIKKQARKNAKGRSARR